MMTTNTGSLSNIKHQIVVHPIVLFIGLFFLTGTHSAVIRSALIFRRQLNRIYCTEWSRIDGGRTLPSVYKSMKLKPFIYTICIYCKKVRVFQVKPFFFFTGE